MRNPIRIVSSIGLLAAALALVGVGLSLDHPVGIEQDLGKGASGSHALDSPNTEAPLDETPLGQMQGMLLQLTTLKDRVRDLESDLARLRDASATTTRRHSIELLVKVVEAAGNTITDLLATAQECNVMVRDPQLTRDYMIRDEMDRLRFHLNALTLQMQDAVRSLEHLRDMFRQDVGSAPPPD